ncbi:MAG: Gfo/Idh/MocA family oxidoreductase [Brevinematales bacterium]|nr:Gfo/Idh/MocA family oxidoreductase [Brevinematales bacterium]
MIKVGILGLSGHFLKRILPAIKDSKIVEIGAIASRDKYKLQRISDELKLKESYGSYDELLESSNVDFVYIPLPNHLHLEWIKKSAAKGKHILCEKPLGINANEVIEITKIASDYNVKIMEAFMYKFHPQWIRTKELIKIGEIGKITAIHSFFGYFNSDPENIRNKLEYGGGALLDIGCYPVSVSRFLSEKEPKKVVSLIKRDKNFNTDILTSAIMDFGDFQSIFTVSTQSVNEQKVYVYGTSGVIEILLPFNAYTDYPVSIVVKTPLGERKIDFGPIDQYKLEFEQFAEAIINNKEPPFSLEDSLCNQKVLDSIFASEKENKWIEIK